MIFDGTYEYPLVLAFACLLRPVRRARPTRPRDAIEDVVLPLVVVAIFVAAPQLLLKFETLFPELHL